jgi:hypothetical protein
MFDMIEVGTKWPESTAAEKAARQRRCSAPHRLVEVNSRWPKTAEFLGFSDPITEWRAGSPQTSWRSESDSNSRYAQDAAL